MCTVSKHRGPHSLLWLPVSSPFDFPKEEEKVIRFWREINAFQTSLKLSEGRPEYTFYDGPPFATGLPHYGHLLAGTIKVCAQHGRGERFAYPLTRLPGHRNQTCPCQRASCFSTIRLGHPWFACRARDRQTSRNHRERRCHAYGNRQVQRRVPQYRHEVLRRMEIYRRANGQMDRFRQRL